MDSKSLYAALRRNISQGKALTAPADRYAYASDASFYYKVPLAVVRPANLNEISALFAIASKHQVPLVFRAAGTSLSGQAVTDGILVDLGRGWGSAEPLEQGTVVSVQPGIVGNRVNGMLQPYKRKIGPDPASINAAMMGGILANNSSGMCCGVKDNAYHTLKSIRFMLPNGHLYDTGNTDDYERFTAGDRVVSEGIIRMRNQLRKNEALTGTIRRKYRIKNTVGYSLNAFLDFDHPLDILGHLLIGSEGTLAFIADAKLKTIPDHPCKTTGLLYFKNPQDACRAIPGLVKTKAEALELMDRSALRSVENSREAPESFKTLPEGTTVILCEYQEQTPGQLEDLFSEARSTLDQLPLSLPYVFTTDAKEQARLWKIRKGLYPSVAAVRAKGTTVLLEDVVVPVERLGDAVTGIQELFRKYHYPDAIIFGHAREGNLHFALSQSFNTREEAELLDVFTCDLSELVNRHSGSLKGEHGTGRQIAPFVKDEWGEEAYQIMAELKKLIDPLNILNPEVVISADPEIHIKDLKTMPPVNDEVDQCVECGYCEDRCPSREYTFTPRQRIIVMRAIRRLELNGEQNTARQLRQGFRFSGLDTCAVDGLCSLACPVEINTGSMVKTLRKEGHTPLSNRIANSISGHYRGTEVMLRCLLGAGGLLNRLAGRSSMFRLTTGIRSIWKSFPLWNSQLGNAPVIPFREPAHADILYFPSCITRMMGRDAERRESQMDILIKVSERAGLQVKLPEEISGVCCGQAFSSKGYKTAYRNTIEKSVVKLWELSERGRLPIVMDVTSCTSTLMHCRADLSEEYRELFDKLTLLDSIDYMHDYLMPGLKVTARKGKVVLHPVCTLSRHESWMTKLIRIGNACAENCIVPAEAGCCGMAGDRGFYFPELIRNAAKREAAEVKTHEAEGYYSSGKTCEMSMSQAVGKNYRSLLYLLEEVTR